MADINEELTRFLSLFKTTTTTMDTDKIRYFLNISFLILAVASIIIYYAVDFRTFIIVCSAAIFVKVMEFIIRFTNR